MKAATVLVVDDDAGWREMLRRVVSRAGYACRTADSPEEAKEILTAHPVELVIVDLRLDDFTSESDRGGLNIAKWIEQNSIKTKVVVISAYATALSMRRAFLQCLIADFIMKQQLDPAELIARIQEIVGAP